MTELIQPVQVVRDEMGHWFHPDLPIFADTDEAGPDAPKWKDWLREQRLETSVSSLEYEEESHPVYQSYFEAEDPSPDITGWDPNPPSAEWFLLAINDTEDGPIACFARRVEVVAA